MQDILTLALCEGIGPVSFHTLLEAFGSVEGVFAASESELRAACPKLGVGALIALRRGPDFGAADAQEVEARRVGVRLVSFRSPGYPAPLLDLPHPPPILYMKGEWREADRRALAVVGTRRPSPYGIRSARAFGLGLAEAGFTVVSGLARGVDTLAHESALEGGARTVAVLGSGLDRLYPPENLGLSRRIAEAGCLISEYPLGMEPLPGNFPRRNRLISALSCGTLVVEAGNDSGALITAEYALEQGRDVFAVPGAIMTAGTRGTHKLIKEGAFLAETVDDILSVLSGLPQAAPARRFAVHSPGVPALAAVGAPGGAGHPGAEPGDTSTAVAMAVDARQEPPALELPTPRPARRFAAAPDLRESHRVLLAQFGLEALPLDEVADRMRALPGRQELPTHRLLAELLQLELMGQLRRLPGARFRRI